MPEPIPRNNDGRMRGSAGRRDRGFALPMAIFTVVAVGLLVAGLHFVSRQESFIGVASANATRAFYVAERGLTETIVSWDQSLFSGLAPWSSVTLVDTLPDGTWSVEVTRMSERMYFIDGTGTVLAQGMFPGATRRIGMVTRLETAPIDPPAALTTQGPIELTGSAAVYGGDVVPPDWGAFCSGLPKNKPGIATNDSSQIVTTGGPVITGFPDILQNPAIGDLTFTQFGELAWGELVAQADLTLAGGPISGIGPVVTEAGVCDRTASANWGDPGNPTGACGGWFPIIYVSGNARIQVGGMGQGLLLVDGDLEMNGNFTFDGIVIVQGNFNGKGNGNLVYGGLMARNVNMSDLSLVGGSTLQYSSCAVNRALLENEKLTRVRPLPSRSWVDLSWNEF